jgi:tetratricopeptide (TPR) repeat protein
MKKLLLSLLISTLYCNAKPVCTSVNIEAIKSLHAQEIKELKLFTLLHADNSIICEAIENSDKVVVVATYKGRNGEEDMEGIYLLSIVMAVVNTKNGKILQSYFYKDILESDAVSIRSIGVDTKTYANLSEYKPFSITIEKGVSASQSHSMFEENLWIFELRNNEFEILLDEYRIETNYSMCEGYRVCKYIDMRVKKVASCKIKRYCPIFFKSYPTIYYALPITDDEEIIEKIYKTPHMSKLVFKNGKYREVKPIENKKFLKELTFNEVEKGAKNGKYYSRYELAGLIYQSFYVEGEFKKVRQLNDIAYYLQKLGHNLEAVMLLEVLLKEFPKRAVAYYNLADAYWELGRKKEAKKMYEVYVKQMKVKGKEKRVPEVVLERVR